MRLTWKIYLLLVLVLVGGIGFWWGNRPYATTNAHPHNDTIVAFGDSITAGFGNPEGDGFVEQLSMRMHRNILNRGIPGATTRDALARLEQDVLALNPGIVLVCLGGNDMLQRFNEDETFGNLEQIIKRIQDRGGMVILIGLDGLLLNPSYSRKYRELAKKMGCPHVPDILGGILGHPALMRDQIHPNAKGHALIADKIEPVLKECLKGLE